MRHLVSTSSFLGILLLTASGATVPVAGSSSLVISEFRTRGPNGPNDEFIELFNRSSGAVSIAGWHVMRSSASGSKTSIVQIAASTSVAAGGFYLLTNKATQGFSGTTAPDASYTLGIDDTGGIALVDDLGNVVDQVGMGTSSAYFETTQLTSLTSNVNQSYERNNGGCIPSQDTDNNAVDFRYNGSSSYPQNSATVCSGGCADVVCLSPLDAQCWDSPGTCANGSCSYNRRATGTGCSDNSVCTAGDACDASGTCQSGTAVTCNSPPNPYCANAQTLVTYMALGTCDDVLGCQYLQTASQSCAYGCNGNLFACNPNPCDNVSCGSPPNDCYAPTGSCQQGVCIYPYKSQGSACSDGNPCTVSDQCSSSGTCVPGAAVVVDDNNPCTADACDSSTGTVSHSPLGDGTSCDDGNFCNGVDTCQSGVCAKGTATVCATPPAGGCYAATGSCNPLNGACSYQPKTQGTACADGDLCTTNDQCDGNGNCSGSTISCSDYTVCATTGASRLYWSGSCNPATGSCAYSTSDTTCATGCNATSGLCNADPCANVSCNAPSDNCYDSPGTCSGGSCTYQLKAEGAACNDGQACTAVDQCSAAGACLGTPLACNTPPSSAACVNPTTSRHYEASGTCSTSSGYCNYGSTDVTCDHGCDSVTGLCASDPCATVTCDQPPSQCHQNLGSCSGGTCSYALKPANSTCDDSKICTGNDVCSAAGVCAGTPVVCNDPPSAACVGNTSRTYVAVGTCNSLGVCTYGSSDTACTAGCNSLTGLCNNDPCSSVVCNSSPGACFADQGTCSQGQCSYPAKPIGVTCNDGNTCTAQDACDANGVCVGIAVSSCGTGGTTSTGGTASTAGTTSITSNVAGSGGTSLIEVGGASATGGTASEGGTMGTSGTATATNGGTSAGAPAGQSGGVAGQTATVVATAGSTAKPATGTGGAGQASGGGPSSGNTGDGAAADASGSNSSGCSCAVPRSQNRLTWAVGLLAVLLLRRRRRH